jgi:hypothetical protein
MDGGEWRRWCSWWWLGKVAPEEVPCVHVHCLLQELCRALAARPGSCAPLTCALSLL